jgi:hypothetical protein
MSVVPSTLEAKIAFYEDHNPLWSTNAVAIGTTASEVTDLETKTTAARAAIEAQRAAQIAAQSATLALHDAVNAMAGAGSDIIKQIRAKAATDGNSVYVLAGIPAPAVPAPVGPPGTPGNFTVELNGDGSLNLGWKCANPVNSMGTIYQVYRRIGAAGEFTFIGASGTRRFIDATLPAGQGGPVTYQITPVRSTVAGPAAQFLVNFGTGGGGEMTASVAPSPKLAA